MSKSRTVMGGLAMLALVAAVLFRVPSAWAAPLHQAPAPDEAPEILDIQEADGDNNAMDEGVEVLTNEPDGDNNAMDEGAEVLTNEPDGDNNAMDEGVEVLTDELDGDNNAMDEGVEVLTNEPDGANNNDGDLGE